MGFLCFESDEHTFYCSVKMCNAFKGFVIMYTVYSINVYSISQITGFNDVADSLSKKGIGICCGLILYLSMYST